MLIYFFIPLSFLDQELNPEFDDPIYGSQVGASHRSTSRTCHLRVDRKHQSRVDSTSDLLKTVSEKFHESPYKSSLLKNYHSPAHESPCSRRTTDDYAKGLEQLVERVKRSEEQTEAHQMPEESSIRKDEHGYIPPTSKTPDQDEIDIRVELIKSFNSGEWFLLDVSTLRCQ